MRLSTDLLAALLVSALAASAWTSCADGRSANADAAMAMACCKDGHEKCPMHDSGAHGSRAEECCARDASTPHELLTIARVDPIGAPVPLVLSSAPLPHAAVLASIHRARVYPSASPPASLSPPPYIAFSTLLI